MVRQTLNAFKYKILKFSYKVLARSYVRLG